MKPLRKLLGRKTSSVLFGRAIVALFFSLIITFVQSVNADTFICSARDVDCLINSINQANANDEEDTIKLKKGTYKLTEAAGSSTSGFPVGFPPITSAITIRGASATKTVIKRSRHADLFRIFSVASVPGSVLKLKRLTISGGALDPGGGSAVNVGRGAKLVLADTVIRDNVSSCGAIAVGSGGTLVVRRSHIVHNKSDSTGAGICADPADVTIAKSTVSFNEAEFDAGGIYCDTCNLTVRDSAFIGNKAPGNEGGGILAFDFDTNRINIFNSIFYGNTARQGGGIAVVGSPVSIRQSLFMQNSAGDLGGAIFVRDADTSALKVSGSLIFQNRSGDDGGGIFHEGRGTVDVVRSLIIGNTPNNCTGCP
ncbi:MAG: hypothetical protein ACR2P1_19575 [Pseudomonadales bacterium]